MTLRHDRRHGGDRPDDGIRTPFQRDRDRVLYSTAFRRLAGITQVVHASEGHVFHNRLTHSLKVGQVGRRLVERLLKHTKPDVIEAVGGVDCDVVETACLAHDLGHPPFGHAAEDELDRLIVDANVSDGFEGNPQSFRIVTHVEVRNMEFFGLNLTSATLNALLKYPNKRASSEDDPEHKKWGYYYDQLKDFNHARVREQPGHANRQSTEAAIMDWADDVSYSVHDLDDWYRAGFVPLDQLLQSSRERERFANWYESEYQTHASAAMEIFDKLEILAGAPLEDPFQDSTAQLAALNNFTTLLMQRYLGFSRPDEVRLTESDERFHVDRELRSEIRILKSLMRRYVYDHPSLRTHQEGQRSIIKKLWTFLSEAVNAANGKGRGLIPLGFRDEFDRVKGSTVAIKARLVTDIISSMTESQALQLHHRVTGIAPGSIYDRIVRR